MQKKNKGLKIAIITILILIILLIVVMASLFLFTDILKSDKEMFITYGTKIFSNEEGIIDNDLIQYIEKKKSNSYKNTSDISFDMELPESDLEQQNLVNDFNIKLSGIMDSANNSLEQNVSLNYSNEVNFPFVYRKIDGLKGFQTQYVGSKYIVKNEEKELDEIGIDLNQVENINFLEKIEVPLGKLQNIEVTYLSNVFEQIEKEKFSKVEIDGKVGYRLSLTGEELKNILLQSLENLKNNENIINQINEILSLENSSSKITKNSIEQTIEDLNNNTVENLEITIELTNNELIGLKIIYGQNMFNVEKEKDSNNLSYNINLNVVINDKTNINAGLTASYSNIITQSVTENYELSLGGDINISADGNEDIQTVAYKYNFKNDVDFTSVDSIEIFNDENSIILSEQDEEVKNNLINAIQQRMAEVNKNQMEEIGANETKNPINYLQPQYIIQALNFSSMRTKLSEQEIASFNNKFELYRGSNEKGVTVKGLLSTIALNNGIDTDNIDIEITEEEENNNPKITEINLNGEEYDVAAENIILLKSMIETESSYRVEFEADSETGLIYRAVINKI